LKSAPHARATADQFQFCFEPCGSAETATSTRRHLIPRSLGDITGPRAGCLTVLLSRGAGCPAFPGWICLKQSLLISTPSMKPIAVLHREEREVRSQRDAGRRIRTRQRTGPENGSRSRAQQRCRSQRAAEALSKAWTPTRLAPRSSASVLSVKSLPRPPRRRSKQHNDCQHSILRKRPTRSLARSSRPSRASSPRSSTCVRPS
jgi:hypothetical protein